MANTLSIFVTTVAAAVGLRLAGQAVPPLAPLVAGGKLLREIDNEMEKAAATSVMEANKTADGRRPNIVMLTFYNGSQTRKDLEAYVAQQGGTAWFQSGSNRRLQAFWHHLRNFRPKASNECLLGHVVHASKDGI
jgi:hypothetical protein